MAPPGTDPHSAKPYLLAHLFYPVARAACQRLRRLSTLDAGRLTTPGAWRIQQQLVASLLQQGTGVRGQWLMRHINAPSRNAPFILSNAGTSPAQTATPNELARDIDPFLLKVAILPDINYGTIILALQLCMFGRVKWANQKAETSQLRAAL